MAQPPGIHARKAALRLLDAIMRRGETLDTAFGAATKDVRKFEDKALARAIASEVLRWMVDLDAAIDSATKSNLPGDAKARMVLRMMLAQWLRLETPPHAVLATGLPLLAGGPRRLAHGVFSTLTKQELALPEAPTLPDDVARRWGERAGPIASGLAEPRVLPDVLAIAHEGGASAHQPPGFYARSMRKNIKRHHDSVLGNPIADSLASAGVTALTATVQVIPQAWSRLFGRSN